MEHKKRDMICLSCGTGYTDDIPIDLSIKILKLKCVKNHSSYSSFMRAYDWILAPCCTDPNRIWHQLILLPYPFNDDQSELLSCIKNLDELKIVELIAEIL